MRKCRVVLEGQDTTAACDKRVKSYGQPEGREGFLLVLIYVAHGGQVQPNYEARSTLVDQS